MQSFLLFASSGKSDPSLSIFLGLGAIALLGIGIYALVKAKIKSDSKTDEDWRMTAEVLGFENPSAWKHWVMNGKLNGRNVSIALKSVPIVNKWSSPTEVRHLFCQINFAAPLGNQFSIEPTPVLLLQSMGGEDTHIPGFDDRFKVVTTDLDYLRLLLKAAPETIDDRVLADEMLYRTIQKGQRICLTESRLELAIKATDISDGLTERIKDLAGQAIGLADQIERRAQRVREKAV